MWPQGFQSVVSIVKPKGAVFICVYSIRRRGPFRAGSVEPGLTQSRISPTGLFGWRAYGERP